MKVRDLIIELAKYNQDSDVALSSDAEGNSINPYADASQELAWPIYQGEYELVHEDDHDPDDEDQPEPLVVLWPV